MGIRQIGFLRRFSDGTAVTAAKCPGLPKGRAGIEGSNGYRLRSVVSCLALTGIVLVRSTFRHIVFLPQKRSYRQLMCTVAHCRPHPRPLCESITALFRVTTLGSPMHLILRSLSLGPALGRLRHLNVMRWDAFKAPIVHWPRSEERAALLHL